MPSNLSVPSPINSEITLPEVSDHLDPIIFPKWVPDLDLIQFKSDCPIVTLEPLFAEPLYTEIAYGSPAPRDYMIIEPLFGESFCKTYTILLPKLMEILN